MFAALFSVCVPKNATRLHQAQTFYELLSPPPSSQHAQFTVLWDGNALLWSKNRVRIHSFAEAKLPPGSELVLTFNAAVGSRSQSPA